jgi:hypothetical protein
MKRGRIPDRDSLFRHSIHPLAFKSRAFAAEKFIHLELQPDGSLLTSVAWERYVPTVRQVRKYGCRTALKMNDTMKAEGKFTEKRRRLYCGAYQLRAGAIRALVGAANLDEISSADVVHHVEEGELAHTDLRIFLKPDVSNIAGTKTAIADRVWNICFGPLRHRCQCDRDVQEHPSLNLVAAPRGGYSDGRSWLRRLWFVTRYLVCYWFWLGSSKAESNV